MSDNFNGGAADDSQDTDLTGMTPEAAFSYLAVFVTNLKEVQKRLEQAAKDRAIWEERKTLAEKNGRQDLLAIADEELKKLDDRTARYRDEESGLLVRVPVLKEQYDRLLSTYDDEAALDRANALLEQLKSVTNDDNPGLKKEFNDIRVNDELEKLKNDLKNNPR